MRARPLGAPAAPVAESPTDGGRLPSTVQYVKKSVDVPKGDFRVVTVRCPAGYVAIAGGFASNIGNVLGVANYPLDNHKGWVAGTSNVFPQVRIATKLTGYAICAKSGTRLFAAPVGAGIAEE